MRRSKLLLLLAWEGSLAAGRDAGGVVPALTKQDSAVPPWLVRGADLAAVPLDLGAGSARRDLQSSSDACDYVSVSGATA